MRLYSFLRRTVVVCSCFCWSNGNMINTHCYRLCAIYAAMSFFVGTSQNQCIHYGPWCRFAISAMGYSCCLQCIIQRCVLGAFLIGQHSALGETSGTIVNQWDRMSWRRSNECYIQKSTGQNVVKQVKRVGYSLTECLLWLDETNGTLRNL